jgi:cellulose synthase/poly-beta-1,6-N-acetylglucosamine synthase-like glycosyltransferase
MLWLAMSASLLGTFGEHRVAQKNEIAISVVVPCFDRFNLLERTLRACFTQRLPDHLGWEILVCDNHPDQLSRTLVEGLQAASPVPLRYLPAPARNIARARNVGVAAASGRYIAFVDDDEAPGPEWLASYYDCLERTGADAAVGPKYPVFPDGEDALLYFRLFKAGRRFVWCPEAAVEEIQPASRLNFAYMETRLKRGSRTSARCRMAVTDHPAATHALLIAVGLAQVVGHGLLHVLTGAIFQPNRVVHRLGIARGLGKLTYRRGDTDFIVETKLPASRTA